MRNFSTYSLYCEKLALFPLISTAATDITLSYEAGYILLPLPLFPAAAINKNCSLAR